MAPQFFLGWRAAFGDSLPAGFVCRDAMPERWLRIHSLPDAKRYAQTDAERAELLHRQNAAATYVLGSEAHCTLLMTVFDESTEWPQLEDYPLHGRVPEHVLSAEYDGDELQFFAVPMVWKSGEFDQLILAVADEKVGPVLLADMQRGRIYAPYDGGADLFFPDPAAVDEARAALKPWLSNRPDGR